MPHTITIDYAQADDIDACIDIGIKVWSCTHEGYSTLIGEELHEAFMGNWKERLYKEFDEDFRRAIEQKRAFVARNGESVVGFISYLVLADKKNGRIGRNAVSPNYRKRGIGSMMYDKVLEAMRKEGIQYAVVHTGGDDAHFAARTAYEKAGFVKAIPSVDYYQKL